MYMFHAIQKSVYFEIVQLSILVEECMEVSRYISCTATNGMEVGLNSTEDNFIPILSSSEDSVGNGDVFSTAQYGNGTVFSGAYGVLLWKLVFEIVEEHGIVVEVVDVLPVGDVLLCLTCAAMDVETRAVGEPEEDGGGREGGRKFFIYFIAPPVPCMDTQVCHVIV